MTGKPEQKTPVHSVVAVVCDILMPLSDEERIRALDAIKVSLGIGVRTPENYTLDSITMDLMPQANLDPPAIVPWRAPRQNVSWTAERGRPTFSASTTRINNETRRLPMVVIRNDR